MKHLIFKKFKFLNSLFYKSLQSSKVLLFDMKRIEVVTFPNLGFNGVYDIMEVVRVDSGRIIYKIFVTDLDYNDFDYFKYGSNNQTLSLKNYLSISKDFKEIIIFDDEFKGIKLKS